MRIFRTKSFSYFAKKSGISDSSLCKAIINAEQGLIDADLGGGVIKQRIARDGRGKSSGFRTIILFKTGDKAFFVHGFAKNEADNISRDELVDFKQLARKMFNYNEYEIIHALKTNTLLEVSYDKETIS